MATLRERPYTQFNFQVTLGDGATAGFQEVSGLGMETTVADYRDSGHGGCRIPGLNKVARITLKRGVIDAAKLRAWLQPGTRQDVLVRLVSEDRHNVVMTWKLKQARIIKHTAGPMNAKGTDVAMEELALACEGLEVA